MDQRSRARSKRPPKSAYYIDTLQKSSRRKGIFGNAENHESAKDENTKGKEVIILILALPHSFSCFRTFVLS